MLGSFDECRQIVDRSQTSGRSHVILGANLIGINHLGYAPNSKSEAQVKKQRFEPRLGDDSQLLDSLGLIFQKNLGLKCLDTLRYGS